MDCSQTKPLLDAYADGELDSANALSVQQHLRECKECAGALEAVWGAKRAVKSTAYYRTPEALRARVSRRCGSRRTGRPLVWAAAWCLTALLAAWLGFSLRRTAPHPDILATQLLESHLRSLQPGHLTDVLSSDKHTVKPWFDGRLDYSPPVQDLAQNGFSLVGGRLDYLNGRTVAVLVYRRAKHVINLYVLPEAGEPVAAPGPQRGYNFLHWGKGGFEFWAVSDLNAEELRQFAALLR